VRLGFRWIRPWNSLVEGGVMIRPVQLRLSLAERLEAYEAMAGEPTEAMAFLPDGAEVVE